MRNGEGTSQDGERREAGTAPEAGDRPGGGCAGQVTNEARTDPGMPCRRPPTLPTYVPHVRASQPAPDIHPVQLRQRAPCGRFTLLMLPAPPVRGQAPGLVDRQRRGHEQRQQSNTGVEGRGRVPQLVKRQGRVRCQIAEGAQGLRVGKQDERGHQRDQEFHEHPIVPEQAPGRAQGHDHPGHEGGEAQRDDDVPTGHLHR